jgi:hypothetical protein
MAKLHNFNSGGYSFLEGGFPYSASRYGHAWFCTSENSVFKRCAG